MSSEEVLPDMDAVVHDLVDDLPRLVSFADAAERLRVNRSTLHRWVNEGRLAVLRTSEGRCGRTLVPRVEIARLVRLLAG